MRTRILYWARPWAFFLAVLIPVFAAFDVVGGIGDIQPFHLSLAGAAALTLGYIYIRPPTEVLAARLVDDSSYTIPMDEIDEDWSPRDVGEDPINFPKPIVPIESERSVGVVGETGSGKSELIKLLVAQMDAAEHEPRIVYDHKDDYKETMPSGEYIVLSSHGSSVHWNLFRELEREEDADELARLLFGEAARDEFFDNAARQLFACTLKYIHRKANEAGATPDHTDLLDFVNSHDKDEMRKALSEYDDLGATVGDILSDESAKMSTSVIATYRQRITDFFAGDLAQPGNFSIREYLDNPQGKTLVLDRPSRSAESVGPMLQLAIDWSYTLAQGRPERTYYVLDEFPQLPALKKIDQILSVGRGQNIQAVVGIQSVNQLYDTYGREGGKKLLGGMPTQVLLRPAGPDSVEYIRDSLGTYRETEKVGLAEEETTVKHQFSEADLYGMRPGECIIRRSDGWVRGRFEMLEDCGRVLEAADRITPPRVGPARDTSPSVTSDQKPSTRRREPADDEWVVTVEFSVEGDHVGTQTITSGSPLQIELPGGDDTFQASLIDVPGPQSVELEILSFDGEGTERTVTISPGDPFTLNVDGTLLEVSVLEVRSGQAKAYN